MVCALQLRVKRSPKSTEDTVHEDDCLPVIPLIVTLRQKDVPSTVGLLPRIVEVPIDPHCHDVGGACTLQVLGDGEVEFHRYSVLAVGVDDDFQREEAIVALTTVELLITFSSIRESPA